MKCRGFCNITTKSFLSTWIVLVATRTFGSPVAYAAIAIVSPSQDNTIAAVDFPDNSSGACDSVFAGATDNGYPRRALLQFDIASAVPVGSTINSATLSMTVTRGGNNLPSTMALHVVTTEWGEGVEGCGTRGGGQGEPATSPAATWNDAQFGTVSWGTPGGDFSATVSASTLVDGSAPIWDSAVNGNMIDDIQSWLDVPTANYGWVLIGDELNSPSTSTVIPRRRPQSSC